MVTSVLYDGNTKESAFRNITKELENKGFIVIPTNVRGLEGIAIRKIKYGKNYQPVITKEDHKGGVIDSDNIIAIRIFEKKHIKSAKGRSKYTGNHHWDYSSYLLKELKKFPDFDFVCRGFFIKGYPDK